MFNSFATHGLQPARLLCPWDFSGKKTGVVAISSLKGSSQLRDPSLVSCLQVDSLPPTHLGRPWTPLRHTNLYVKVKSLSCIQLFVTPWTAAYQASLSMGFSRQEYWSGVPLPSPGISM